MRRLDEGKVQVVEEQAELEASMDGRRDEVNRFSKLIGGTAEEDAADVVEHVARRRGVRLHGEPVAVDLDGDGERDRWARVVDADGDEVSILVKAKARRRADPGHPVRVSPLTVDGLVAHGEAHGEAPETAQGRAALAAETARRGHGIPWPPGRNDRCWCGSGRKYKGCCGPVPPLTG